MIVLIMGAPCSGKTTVRNEVFNGCDYVDIYDFQQEVRKAGIRLGLDIAEENWLRKVKEKIKCKNKDDILVLEHCLSNKNRRQTYLKEIKEITDEEIICLFVVPRKEDRHELIRRKFEPYKDIDVHDISSGVLNMNGWYEECDKPSKEDGFDSVLRIEPVVDKEFNKKYHKKSPTS